MFTSLRKILVGEGGDLQSARKDHFDLLRLTSYHYVMICCRQ